MELLELIGVTIVICSAIVALAVLDKKYQLNLNMNWGEHLSMDGDFWGESSGLKKKLKEKNKTIEALTKRVEVLERIVTDPAEQLKQEIDKL